MSDSRDGEAGVRASDASTAENGEDHGGDSDDQRITDGRLATDADLPTDN